MERIQQFTDTQHLDRALSFNGVVMLRGLETNTLRDLYGWV